MANLLKSLVLNLLWLALVYAQGTTLSDRADITQSFSSGDNSYLTFVGKKDTITSNAMYIGGYPYLTAYYQLTQTDDSVMIDSIVITVSGDGDNYLRTPDKANSIAWSRLSAQDSTANTWRSKSLSVPKSKYMKVTVYNSKANAGPNQILSVKLNMGP